jgi:rare lipoprotein A
MKKVFLLFCFAFAYMVQNVSATPPEIGIATYYGDNFHGRKTSSDEIYDKEQLTAAHKTLPYGTIVRVTVLATGATVDVRINDKGPFVKGRIITVSRKAADVLGILKETDPQVKLEVVQKIDAPVVPVVEKPTMDEKALLAAEKELAEKQKQFDADKVAAEKKAAADKVAAEKKAAADKIAAEKKAAADKKAADKKAAAAKPAEKTVASKPAEKTIKSAPVATAPTAKEEPAANFVKEAAKIKQGQLYKMQVLEMEQKGFGVQVAAFSDYESVFDQLSTLQENHYKGGLVYVDNLNDKNYYKVILGPFFTREEAVSYCNSLRKKTEMKDAFVVDLDKLNQKAQAVSVVVPGTATTPLTPATAPKTSAKVVAPAKKGGK